MTNECPDLCYYHIFFLIDLHVIESIISSCALFYETFSCVSASCFHLSFLDFFSNVSSHYSYTKVFLLPAPPLSLTALCPLCLRPVCHVIRFLQKRHLVTLLPAYATLSFLHLSAKLSKTKVLVSILKGMLTWKMTICLSVTHRVLC